MAPAKNRKVHGDEALVKAREEKTAQKEKKDALMEAHIGKLQDCRQIAI